MTDTELSPDTFIYQQVSAMQDVIDSAPPEYNFTYKLCIYNTAEFNQDIILAYKSMSEASILKSHTPRFILGMDNNGGNVLADVPYGHPHQKVFIVNAGDLRSFIGNGCSFSLLVLLWLVLTL